MAILNIYLLGGFRLVYDSRPVVITNGRMQSLLAYLVLHRETPQPRLRLASLFWPDSSEAQARTNLRNLIHLLRQALPDEKEYLCTDGPTIQWREDSKFSLDIAELEKAMPDGTFDTVVNLYTGDLLPDCYDEWVIPKREQLRQIYTDALEKLIQQKENEHDYHAAIAYAQCLIRHEPLQEQSYRELMRLYALSGDRIGVIRTYNTCATVLQNELGVEPSEGTRETYNHCLKIDSPAKPSLTSTALPLLASYSNNLPLGLTRFIGREQEKSEAKKLLAAHRLVTLTGTGGIGKTRLAIRVAREVLDQYEHGVWLVELAPLTNPDLVPDTVANVLGFQSDRNQPVLQGLSHYLSEKTLLLVLDNCEHLIDACAHLAEYLLSKCPNLHILTTSREILEIGGETALRVPSLSLPPSEWQTRDILEQSEAVQFFIERAATVLPGFELTDANMGPIAKICHRLDGIALAIELAAARVKIMDVETIASRLIDAFHLLTNGSRTALLRQQTLQATLDWSYNLLSEKEQIVLNRLSVFTGGWTLGAAESVCADNDRIKASEMLDLLTHLVNKSLVMERRLGEEVRFHLLETTRQYAQEKFSGAANAKIIWKKHAEYYANFSFALWQEMYKLRTWPESVDKEQNNFRSALNFSINVGELKTAQKILLAFGKYLSTQGNLKDCLSLYEKAIPLNLDIENMDDEHKDLLFHTIAGAIIAAWELGEVETSRKYSEINLQISSIMNDKFNFVYASSILALTLSGQGNITESRKLLLKALEISQEIGNFKRDSFIHNMLGCQYLVENELGLAKWHLQKSLNYARQFDYNNTKTINPLMNLGHLALKTFDYSNAKKYYLEGSKKIVEVKDNFLFSGLLVGWENLFWILGKHEPAFICFGYLENLLNTKNIKLEAYEAEMHQYIKRNLPLVNSSELNHSIIDGASMTIEQITDFVINS